MIDPSRCAGAQHLPEQRDNSAVELAELARAILIDMPPLSPMQRRVVDLVILQGCHQSEAAKKINISRSSLRIHLARAKKKLKRVAEILKR